MISRRVRNCRESVRQKLLDKALNQKDLISFEGERFELPEKSDDLSEHLPENSEMSGQRSFKTDDLHALLSEKLRLEQGLDYGLDQILIGQNAASNFSLLLQTILNPGDEVIVTKPYREHFPDLIRLSGGSPVILETGADKQFKPELSRLKDLVTPKTRAIVINASMGLLGGNYTINELIALADFFVKRKILVIWDEMDNEFCFDSKQALNIASINQKIKQLSILLFGHAIPIHADSHCYVAANRTIIAEIKKIGSYFTPGPFIEGRGHRINKKSTMAQTKELLSKRRQLMIDCLQADEDISLLVPAGGYYIYLDISEVLSKRKNGNHSDNSVGFCDALLTRENILAMPGEVSGLRRMIRLSYLGTESEIKTGCERLLNFIKKY